MNDNGRMSMLRETSTRTLQKRNVLTIVLAGLLITLPVERVFAQAAQQEAQKHQPLLVPVAPVPVLVPETALPWQSFAENPLVGSSSLADNAVAGPNDWSIKKTIWIAVGLVAVTVIIFKSGGLQLPPFRDP